MRNALLVLLLALSVLMVFYLTAAKQRAEHFEVNNAMQHNIEKDAALAPPPNRAAEKRPCTIYFTPNAELCDDVVNAWYQQPLQHIIAEHQKLVQQKQDTTKAKQLAAVIKERTSGKLPNGLCKMTFGDGLVEQATDGDGYVYPYKYEDAATTSKRGAKDTWAFCYAQGASTNNARDKARRFSDGQVVISDTYAGSPFGDGQLYGRVSFTSFPTDNFYCDKPVARVQGVPSTWIVLKLNIQNKVTNVSFGTYAEATQTIDTVSHATNPDAFMGILRGMFQTTVEGTALWVEPKVFQARVFHMQFDMCNRLVSKSPIVKEMEFSLSKLGASATRVKLYQSSPNSVTIGTLEELAQLYASKDASDTDSMVLYEALSVIDTSLQHFLGTQVQAIGSTPFTGLDTAMESNDGNVYIDVGPLSAVARVTVSPKAWVLQPPPPPAQLTPPAQPTPPQQPPAPPAQPTPPQQPQPPPPAQSTSSQQPARQQPPTFQERILFRQPVQPPTLRELLAGNPKDGVYAIIVDDTNVVRVRIGTFDGKPWALALCYHHKGGTNPPLRVIQKGYDWPLYPQLPLGSDGSIVAPTEEDGRTYPAGAAWGHIGNAVMSSFNVQEMLWYGKSKNKEINFVTDDKSVISYCQTGKGKITTPIRKYRIRAGNALLPWKAAHGMPNQGDYAMTEYPFYQLRKANWAIRGLGTRWEVDNEVTGYADDTIHQVWIR